MKNVSQIHQNAALEHSQNDLGKILIPGPQNVTAPDTFFDVSLWTSFFDLLAHPRTKTVDFGTPLAPSCVPKWRPKSLKYRQKAQKISSGCGLGVVLENDLLPISLLERSWAPFWSIWDGLFMISYGILYNFY